jgi:hypothetical protein
MHWQQNQMKYLQRCMTPALVFLYSSLLYRTMEVLKMMVQILKLQVSLLPMVAVMILPIRPTITGWTPLAEQR